MSHPNGIGEFSESNGLLNNPSALREQFQEDGYLFFRNILNRERILSLRMEVLKIMQDEGWLKSGTSLMDGIVDISKKCLPHSPEYLSVYNQIAKLQGFHRHAHMSEITNLMTMLIGGPVIPLPFMLARIVFPQNEIYARPIHQDYMHHKGGTQQLYTCWAPLGDCPIELGSLAVHRASHKLGEVEHRIDIGDGGFSIDLAGNEGELLSANFLAGDLVIFHSLTFHEGLPNMTQDRIRISIDCRYQSINQPITERAFKPSGKITWEEIYEDWEDDDLKYYWKKVDLNIAKFDWGVYDRRDWSIIDEANRGNEHTRPHLIKIIEQCPVPAIVAAAKQALESLSTSSEMKH